MQEINVNELRPHPKNDYFFDDMSGQKWNEFLESVKTSGIIEPIVVTQDKVIVSGHQRVRACKELGISKIKAEVKIYCNEDQVIKDLMNPGRNSRDFSHGMDRPLIFIGFVFCLIVSLVADVFFDYIFAHIAQCTHVVTGRPQMPAPIL